MKLFALSKISRLTNVKARNSRRMVMNFRSNKRNSKNFPSKSLFDGKFLEFLTTINLYLTLRSSRPLSHVTSFSCKIVFVFWSLVKLVVFVFTEISIKASGKFSCLIKSGLNELIMII